MITIEEILVIHANWVASLGHAGLDESTLNKIATELERTNRLIARVRHQSNVLDSHLEDSENIELLIRACETAVAELDTLVTLAEEVILPKSATTKCRDQSRTSLEFARATRDRVISQRCAAELFRRLTGYDSRAKDIDT